jgi:ferredoxin-NADP reductase
MCAERELAVVVSDIDEVAEGVLSITLTPANGAELRSWTPGAHIDVLLPIGLERQYSLCGDIDDTASWRIAVLRQPSGGGGSAYIHDRLRVGDRLRVRGPRNNFPLVAAARYLFIAGGVGITPILPMICAARQRGAAWALVYGGRTRASMAFLPELERYGPRLVCRPQDEFGLLDLDAILADLDTITQVYCCGPESLIAAVEDRGGDWAPGTLHVERFAPRAVTAAPARSFEVVLERSGLTLHVPEDQSVLDVVLDAGIDVLSSCEEGTCGTCETRVLDGEPEHLDSILTSEQQRENAAMMICVSRCKGDRLVLDL